MNLKFSPPNEHGTIQVHYTNDVKMGELLVNDDGYLVFFPELRGGYWSDWNLKELADKMIELNVPWDKELNSYFDENI